MKIRLSTAEKGLLAALNWNPKRFRAYLSSVKKPNGPKRKYKRRA